MTPLPDIYEEPRPRRPGWMNFDRHYNNFLMDFENSLLKEWARPAPTGRRRYLDPEWAVLVEANVHPHHSDVCWDDYVSWVSAGGGDEWFQPDEPINSERVNGYSALADDLRRIGEAGG